MKKLFLAMVFSLWGMTMLAATHTVARGESLQSIATRYNVTVEQLIEANPGADKLFYVGLKLNIPEPPETGLETRRATAVPEVQPIVETAACDTVGETSVTDTPGWDIIYMLEYGFLGKEDGVKGTNYTYAITIGGNYYFMHNRDGVFAGVRIGYNSANYNLYASDGRGSSSSITSTSHFITLPLQIGYSFASSNRDWGITPYAGFDFNFCVGGKLKSRMSSAGSSSEQESKFKKKTGIDARVGIMIRLGGFNIGGAYVIPLNKNQEMYFGDDAYIAVSIGFGF